MDMKRYSKKQIDKIARNNPRVDRNLLEKSQKEIKKLEKLNIIQTGYGLVIPYSKIVKSAI